MTLNNVILIFIKIFKKKLKINIFEFNYKKLILIKKKLSYTIKPYYKLDTSKLVEYTKALGENNIEGTRQINSVTSGNGISL